ncbi:MAG: hypothetical protein U0354_10640 [Candidatus Sericytochromatia bacterium]
MVNKSNTKKAVDLVLISLIALGVATTSACNRKKPGDPTTPSTSKPPEGGGEPVPEDPITPGDNNNDGQSDLPQEPTDTPEPLPAPTKPVEGGESAVMVARAIAKTTSYILPIGGLKGTYVNVELTWQPVIGAAEYWIYKGMIPTKEQATKGSAYRVQKANGITGTIFVDGVLPPSFSGGNIWDKVKKGFSAVTIKPGVEYKYKVFAVDDKGAVVGQSDAAITIPLPPIAAPTNIKVSETSTTKPLFQWEATQGIAPDGYYLSVHPPIAFGKQSTPQGVSFGYAYWSTFRSEQTKLARYGSSSDNAVAYPGTLPFDVNFPLKMQNRYSVSITSVKTDTNDMRTAKAISRGWSESKMFVVGTETPVATNPATGTPTTPASGTPTTQSSSSSEESIFTKLKNKVRSLFGG